MGESKRRSKEIEELINRKQKKLSRFIHLYRFINPSINLAAIIKAADRRNLT